MTAFVFGMALGVTVTGGIAWWAWMRKLQTGTRSTPPPGLEFVLDLFLRAQGADAVCLVGTDVEPVALTRHDGSCPPERSDRLVNRTRIAQAESRDQVVREEGLICVGELGWGVGLAVAAPHQESPEAVLGDLRQILRELTARERLGAGRRGRRRDSFASTVDTLSGVAFGMCERARVISGRPTAVVLREGENTAKIIAVSTDANRRLLGVPVSPDSAVGRACVGDAPVVARSSTELWGRLSSDRRQKNEQGTAYPLRDGPKGVGALVILGPHQLVDSSAWEQIMWLSADSGSQFAAAAAIKEAEDRARTDPLTGLPNRAALNEAMGAVAGGPCAVLVVDLDYFKKLNDSLGHAAGDAALKHVALIFGETLRQDDVAARIGGEEFALWLPGSGLDTALEIAERVRLAIETSRLEWSGTPVPLSCSIGVASCPETATQIPNLLPAADAALYRAKRSGRNRVEASRPSAAAVAGED
jgi:diguanylate cyclase (GGDEF)-like protein